jgi:hypothetical protein
VPGHFSWAGLEPLLSPLFSLLTLVSSLPLSVSLPLPYLASPSSCHVRTKRFVLPSYWQLCLVSQTPADHVVWTEMQAQPTDFWGVYWPERSGGRVVTSARDQGPHEHQNQVAEFGRGHQDHDGNKSHIGDVGGKMAQTLYAHMNKRKKRVTQAAQQAVVIRSQI